MKSCRFGLRKWLTKGEAMRRRKWAEKVEAALVRGRALKAERKSLLKDLPAALTRAWRPIENLRRVAAFRAAMAR